MSRRREVKGFLFGNDHDNDFEGFDKGLEIAYTKKTGYEPRRKDRGGRVIELKETADGVDYNHYIVLENGEKEHMKESKIRGDNPK